MTFQELIDNHKELFRNQVDSDILDLFENCCGMDEIETLTQSQIHDRLNFSGGIDEWVDGMIDIYNSDLEEWACKNGNHNYITQAKRDGLTSVDSDWHQEIQAGQWVYYGEEAWREIKELEDAIDEAISLEDEKEEEEEEALS